MSAKTPAAPAAAAQAPAAAVEAAPAPKSAEAAPTPTPATAEASSAAPTPAGADKTTPAPQAKAPEGPAQPNAPAAEQAQAEEQTEPEAATADAKQAREDGAAPEAATAAPGAPDAGADDTSQPDDGRQRVQRMPSGRAIQRAPRSPESDPAFQAVTTDVKSTAAEQKQHAPAEQKATEAAAAAKMPQEEKLGAAQNTQTTAIDAAAASQEQATQGGHAPGFDKDAFKASVKARIDQLTPQDPRQMEDIEGSGVFGNVKSAVDEKVQTGKDQAQGNVDDKVAEAPNPGAVPDKPVTALQPNTPGQAPGQLDASGAAPKPKGPEEVEQPLQAQSQQLDTQMATAQITPEQLQTSNEPTFQAALQAKTGAQEHVQQALPQYRTKEQGQIQGAQNEAGTLAQTGLGTMFTSRSGTFGQMDTLQNSAKGQDETKRAEIGRQIDGIFQRTKADVEGILTALDTQVDQAFTTGADTAKQAAVDYIKRETDAYKAKRYSGEDSVLGVIGGAASWVGDQVVGMPDEYYQYYRQGRDLYIAEMDKVLDKVGTIVGDHLARAHQRVQQGRDEIAKFVESQPEELREVAQQAAQDAEGKFGELEQTIDSKQQEVVDSLAQKYVEKLQALDSELEQMREAEKGLLAKAGDLIDGVIQTITELKNLLLSTLQRAAGAVMTILNNPVEFLGNLLSAVGQGLRKFAGNIGTHLQTGLIEWLTGALAAGGIQLPATWDLQGIFSLVMQILGLTYQQIRAQIVKALGPIGETVIGALEQAWDIFQIIQSEGIAGLWKYIQDQIGDLKAMVIDQIKDMIATQVIQAGIDWLIGILGGPAGAFIKAVQAIVRVVSWFVENASRLASLVNSIIDSVTAIAAGDIGGAAGFIEQSLAKALPSVISFLANLLGLGGISHKVAEIIQKVRAPIQKAIDWLVQKAVALGKKLWGMLKGKGDDKDEAGTPEEEANKRAALPEAERIIDAEGASPESVERQLPGLQDRHNLKQKPRLVQSGTETYYIQLMRKDDRTDEQELISKFGNKNRDLNRDPDEVEPHEGRPDDAPIVDSFRLAYNRLDSWSKFIKIHHQDLYEELNDLFDIENREDYATAVKNLTKKYKQQFRDINASNTTYPKQWYIQQVESLAQQIQNKNNAIAAWYKSKTGKDKSEDDLTEDIHKEGTEIWREEWKNAIIEINRILQSAWPPTKNKLEIWVKNNRAIHPYMIGSIGELDYIGSLATGIKGPPKQHIRFNSEKFDVDANLKAPPLAAYALQHKEAHVDRGRIFSKDAGISILDDFTKKVGQSLEDIPGINKDDPFDVVIEARPEDIKKAEQSKDKPHMVERLRSQKKAEKATHIIYELRDKLIPFPNTYARLIKEMTPYLQKDHIQGTQDGESLLPEIQYDTILELLQKY